MEVIKARAGVGNRVNIPSYPKLGTPPPDAPPEPLRMWKGDPEYGEYVSAMWKDGKWVPFDYDVIVVTYPDTVVPGHRDVIVEWVQDG